jgi:hypothetical protein
VILRGKLQQRLRAKLQQRLRAKLQQRLRAKLQQRFKIFTEGELSSTVSCRALLTPLFRSNTQRTPRSEKSLPQISETIPKGISHEDEPPQQEPSTPNESKTDLTADLPPNSGPQSPIEDARLDLNADEVELQAMDSPPSIFNCPGHWLIRHSDPNREGIVGSVDLESQLMKVFYEEDSTPNQYTPEEISYNEPDLLWYQEKQPTERGKPSLFTKRTKPSFERALGSYILLEDEEEEGEEGGGSSTPDMALVVDLNRATKMLKVQFVIKISRDGRVVCDEEVEEVPYSSTKSIIWMQGRLTES